jgi:cation diffusion facilitator family transporter
MVFAIFTHSVGLLGDALHNLSDVSTSLLVFLGFWVSKRPSSRGHPYGYDRAEDIAGIGVALAIWASALFAGIESVRKLVHHGTTVHLGWGIAAAVVGIAGNQAVAWYKGRVGRRIQSATLVADARHSWLDAISSLGAAAGLVAVALGFPLGDPIAGIAITIMICHVGYEVTAEVVSHLMDAVDPLLLDQAENGAMTVPGIEAARVRGRWAGRSLRLDIRAELDPALALDATTSITSAIEEAVFNAVGEARVVEVQAVPHQH